MKLDLSKLKNVKHLSGGKTTAQCPACAAEGGDAKGEHLAIYADGRFGCVVHPKDKAHNKLILRLAGSNDRGDGGYGCRLLVKPMQVKDSEILMKVGRLGRVKSTPCQPNNQPLAAEMTMPESPEATESRSERPTPEPVPANVTITEIISPKITDEKLREFLDLPALAA